MPIMKAWQASAYGAEGNPADTIANLKLADVEIPSAGAGQIQVKVSLAAVNPIDWKLFSGGLHGICPCTFPYVPGFDITGEVTAVGEGACSRRLAVWFLRQPPDRLTSHMSPHVCVTHSRHVARRFGREPARSRGFFSGSADARFRTPHFFSAIYTRAWTHVDPPHRSRTRLPPGVSDFQVGDTVCADLGLCETCVDPKPAQGNAGAFAPFAAVPASLCAKTDGVDPVAAAGLPLAGLTAYQALFTKAGRTFTGDTLGDLKPGQKLCIIGGATAVGAFAIQLAKNAGAFVACTASSNDDARGVKKTEACKALGADVVIDYGDEEWSDVLNGQEYDLVFDTIGKQEDWANAAKVLKKGSDFISVANFAADAAANESNVFKNFLLKSDGGDLRDLVAMVKAGKLTVPVDSVVPFADVPAALAKSSAQANAGKIVVDVAK